MPTYHLLLGDLGLGNLSACREVCFPFLGILYFPDLTPCLLQGFLLSPFVQLGISALLTDNSPYLAASLPNAGPLTSTLTYVHKHITVVYLFVVQSSCPGLGTFIVVPKNC